MKWPWTPLSNARRERDHALVRAATLEARCRDLMDQQEQLRAEKREERQAFGRVIDNALMSAGSAPVFDPTRAAVRAVEDQQADAARAQTKAPLSQAQWRKRMEALDAEVAARDRKARLAEELQREAAARKREKLNG